jgi:prepilin-type N-terminal cleavage/methylation domain-containing protein
MKTCGYKASGFSLIELALVLVVVALLMGGLLVPLSMQIEQQKIRETQKAMEEIKEALLGYSLTSLHLPCPDKTSGANNGANDAPNDGVEDFTVATGQCVVTEGNIPWATLGVASVDGWNSRIHYSVTATFSNRSPLLTYSLVSAGTLRVCLDAACVTPVATNVPAVILSFGKNGYGAINASNIANPAPSSADELANTDLTVDFVSHPTSNLAGQEFDDLVTWLSPNILYNRMVAAGRLP